MTNRVTRAGLTGLLWSVAGGDRQAADADLVVRYARDRDEAAFRELVRRLGPSVYGVCRRHLGDTPDADDAFQVTFLVLAQKAGGLRDPGRVTGWVYGVADLAARKLKLARRRRERRVACPGRLPDVPARDAPDGSDLAERVGDELTRLPERLRLPILLCGVRGLTVAQAAAELGWPPGTVASRLSRGRAELNRRLAAGVAVAGGVLPATAGVPPRLTDLTAAMAVAGTPPPAVAALATKVTNAMLWTPLRRLVAGLLVACSMAAAGGGLLLPSAHSAPVPAQPPADKAGVLERIPWEGVTGLLRQESVRKEVGLADDEYKALVDTHKGGRTALAKKMEADAKARGANVDAILEVQEEYQAGLRALEVELGKKAADGLKPAGAKRLKQAVLQAAGPRGLLDRVVIRELQLTAEQEDKIAAAVGPPRSPIGLIPNASVAKAAAVQDAVMEKALKELTADQRKRWAALVGPPFPTADLLKAHPMSEESLTEMVGDVGVGPAVPPPPPPPAEKK